MARVDNDARFTSMFERHHQEVLAYCARRTTRSDAEDATAEVFAVAWRRIDEVDWETVRPWLYGIARGVMNNRLRSVGRRGRLTKKIASMAPQTSEDPEVVVVRRAQDAEVVRVLRRLRQSDQEVLMLAAWEELTAPEISIALGISTSAAEQRLHRAKSRFAKMLEKKRPDDSHPRAAGQGGGH